jgi:hypothetical protein
MFATGYVTDEVISSRGNNLVFPHCLSPEYGTPGQRGPAPLDRPFPGEGAACDKASSSWSESQLSSVPDGAVQSPVRLCR